MFDRNIGNIGESKCAIGIQEKFSIRKFIAKTVVCTILEDQ